MLDPPTDRFVLAFIHQAGSGEAQLSEALFNDLFMAQSFLLGKTRPFKQNKGVGRCYGRLLTLLNQESCKDREGGIGRGGGCQEGSET